LISSISIINDLTVTAETLDMGTVPLTVGGNVSIAGSGIYTGTVGPDFNGDLTIAGTFTVPTIVNLAGDFNNTGTYTSASNTLILDNAATAQSISGNATAFNNVTVAKAAGVDLTLNASTTINGILALQNEGNVVLSSGDLIIPTTGSITGNAGGSTTTDFSAARMIQTDGTGTAPHLVKNAAAAADWSFVFPIGVEDSGDQYTPVTVGATNDNITTGTLSIRSVNGTGTTESISGSATTLNRHFDFDLTGLTGAVIFDILFQYGDGDVLGDENSYISSYSEGGGWIQAVTAQSSINTGTNVFGASASLDGTISFSTNGAREWILGDNDLLFPHLYTYTSGGGDWNTATDWSLSVDGSTSDGTIPSGDNAVTILLGQTMTMDNNTNAAASIEVLGTLDIAATTGHSLNTVTGTGTLQIGAVNLDTYVDTGSGSTFFGAGGGTVEYGGDAVYTLPTAFTSYENLVISGTTQNTHDKTLGVNTTVFGDLTVTNVDLENGSNLDLELRGSFSAGGGGTFQIANGTFVFANSTAATLSSSIVFGASGSLTLDNFGQKDLGGIFNANNVTINSASGDFNANSNNINVTGNWNNKSSANKLTNPATVTFNGGVAQQIDGDNTFATTNFSTSATAVTVGSGTQTFTGALTLAAGTTLDIGTNTIRISNTLDVDAGTFTAGSGTLVYESTSDPETQVDAITVGTLEIDKGGISNTLDNDPATISFTNLTITSGEYSGADLNIIGNLRLTLNASFDFTSITTIDINGDFFNAASIDLDAAGVTQLNIAGDFTNTGTFTPPTTVVFDGATAQTINSNLIVDNFEKDGGGDLTLNANLTVNSSIVMTSGDLISSSTNILSLEPDAVADVSSDGSHVIGTMRKAINSTSQKTLKFKLGNGSEKRALELDLTQTAATKTWYTATLFSGAPAARTKLGTINHVSGIRHYNVTADNSILAAASGNQIRFDYGVDDAVVDENNLLVAKSDGSGNWLDLGGSVVGTALAGTISSVADFSSFSDIVLASDTPESSLPVELIHFTGRMKEKQAVLSWVTASEENNDHFEIERSSDGVVFHSIGDVEGQGTISARFTYDFIDDQPMFGVSYYRLIQVDYDGASTTYPKISIANNAFMTGIEAVLFPNPTSVTNINLRLLSGDENSPVFIQVFDLMGKLIHSQRFEAALGKTDLSLALTHKIDKGIYHVFVVQGGNQVVEKLIIK
jgi:hypothetical protein